MNHRLIATRTLTLALSFGCFVGAAAAKEGSDEGPAKARAVATANGYKVGFAKGKQDGVGGLSRTPTRWEGAYVPANRREFFRGYEDGYNEGIKPGAKLDPAPNAYGQPLTAVKGRGIVVIKEGRRRVAVCRTASPFVEQTRFIEEQNKIVVKSRGRHGPATVELFDARTGRREGTVKAFELSQGGPKWAEGMAD